MSLGPASCPIELADFRAVEPLFTGIEHSVALVWAVIQGHTPGRVFVDYSDTPTVALLTSGVGYCYVGGRSDHQTFDEALAPLLLDIVVPSMEEKELILFAFSDAWRARLDDLLCPRGAVVIHRKMFHFAADRFAAHAGWRARVPPDMSMCAIDAAFVTLNF